ncbi:asparagine synthetase domain-containing protein CG17486 [Bradysia coprophila]|uniref:asparagine synthetase domain-containing protein CG17486 n=1 Tax=Bradysia coprophila TaxID=38358 RepID=UPI00187D94CB|nr:asparagine synthetase domain-containing protein CG17486 [Bradysia coprophila]
MCGIFCSLTRNSIEPEGGKLDEHTKKLLQNRGPDLQSQHQVECNDFTVTFAGFVLWQQGNAATVQPVVDRDHIMLFNGDIYSTGSVTSKTPEQSDTEWLFSKIAQCNEEIEFFDLMKHIQGPFSLIYFNNKSKRLYFARDSLGRQTLLIGSYRNSICITSVASKVAGDNSFIEVPPLGIFSLNLSNSAGDFNIELSTWQDLSVHEHFAEQLGSVGKVIGSQISLHENLEPFWMQTDDSRSDRYTFTSLLSEHLDKSPLDILTILSQCKEVVSTSDELIDLLTRSLKQRVEATPQLCKNCIKSPVVKECNHPKVGILFSGGIDCTILALMAHEIIDSANAIDLINVSFEKINRNPSANRANENYETPDRLTSRQTLKELTELCPNRKWNLIEVNVTREELKEALKEKISDLCYPLNSILDESLGAALWFAASSKGLVNSVHYESPCRVLLIGSGADELFGGYTRHRNAFLRSGQSWTHLDNELNLDWTRLPSRNLARDDRIIGDHSVTARSPFVEENVAFYVRNLNSSQKCFHLLPEGVGDKLLLRLCGFRMGLRNVCWLKKRALQFGSRVADRKQNAKDVSDALR